MEVKPAAMREGRDIEWLVNWALEKQRVASLSEVKSDMVYLGGLKSQLGALGSKVDGGSKVADRRWAHPDAEIIWAKLQQMHHDARSSVAASLVIQHGRLGTQPDWGREGCGRWVLQRKNNGQGKAIRRFLDQKNGRGLIGFEWKWVGLSVESLELQMLEWAAWHAALIELKGMVNSSMRNYVATGPLWLAAPWDDPSFVKQIGPLGDMET